VHTAGDDFGRFLGGPIWRLGDVPVPVYGVWAEGGGIVDCEDERGWVGGLVDGVVFIEVEKLV
jgi:hypothetical protein